MFFLNQSHFYHKYFMKIHRKFVLKYKEICILIVNYLQTAK